MTKTAALIHNDAAGPVPSRTLLSRAVRELERGGWEIDVYEPESGRSISDLASQAVHQQKDAVFVAGGDGTVGSVAAVLAGSDTALGVLPAGTANVWAQELGLRGLDWIHLYALEEAARRLVEGSVREVDVGVCNDLAFLMWTGIGLDAQVVSAMEPRERWEKTFGIAHYASQALVSTMMYTGVPMRVSSGEKQWERRFLMAIASNIRSYAGGIVELSPDAKVDDGLLEFWLFEGKNMADALWIVLQILRGDLMETPGVVHFQAAEALFEAEGTLTLHMDGEPRQMEPPLRFSVKHKSLKIICPAERTNPLYTVLHPPVLPGSSPGSEL
ncbi:MAG: diacylglycerol kinase family lipid kinase [Anaerolineales bacterium]|nr:diacylglycerol kinase family lipid kinase [Anaerolineales bacterium]